MDDQEAKIDDAGRRRVRRVQRGLGDLRRGLPVVLVDGGRSSLVLAAETARETTLAEFRSLAERPIHLVITARRANVLHILPAGHEVQLVPVEERWTAAEVHEIVDPTQDLARPLKGPFPQIKAAPDAIAQAAAVLCKQARLLPAALVGPLPAGDGRAWAAARDLLAIAADDAIAFEDETAARLEVVTQARVPLRAQEKSRVIAFRPRDGGPEHLAILIGDPNRHDPVLTRLHSACLTGDVLGSLKCDCGEQLQAALEAIAAAGGGILLYLAQEGRGIGLVNKLRAYRLQEQGYDTVEANQRLGFEADERLFRPAAEMLKTLGFTSVRLLTNNPDKVAGLEALGIRVSERVPHAFPANKHNEHYLATKRRKSGHFL